MTSNSLRMLRVMAVAILVWIATPGVSAQPTEFIFQGRLQNGGSAASGDHDFQLVLYDALDGGTQLGPTLARNAVAVSSGIFSIKLDFGGQFTGGQRYLEVRVRQTGAAEFTPLLPRQPVSNSPYALYSYNATNATTLNGVAATGFIQNTTSVQTNTSFNIGQTGSANIFNAVTQYNLGGYRFLSSNGADSTFVGILEGGNSYGGFANSFFGAVAGASITDGAENSFFGAWAGYSNSTGSRNSFFGRSAGVSNTEGVSNAFSGHRTGAINSTGSANSFFGTFTGGSNSDGSFNAFYATFAGDANTTGNFNAFYGSQAGFRNTTAHDNSFFGAASGFANRTGDGNSFFGRDSGIANTTGPFNTALGWKSGLSNTTEAGNTFIGAVSNGVPGITNSTAIGGRAQVSQSNSIVLGSINGVNGAVSSTNVGIGTTAPLYRLHVVGENVRVEGNLTTTFPRFSLNFKGGAVDEKKWQNYASTSYLNFSALNDAENAETFWLIVNRGPGTSISSVVFPNGNVVIDNLGAPGSTSLCRNALNQISTCTPGSLTENGSGESARAVNALREQLKQQKKEIDELKQQKKEIDELKQIVCTIKPDAAVCKAPGPRR